MASGSMVASEAMATAQTGQDVLEAAVREHTRMVFRIAYSVLRNHHDAEDATQETFVRVLRYGAKLEGIEDQKRWLARIAWRVAVGRRTSARHTTSDHGPEDIEQLRSSMAGADEFVLGSEMMDLLEKVIATLPAKLRDPLVLSTVEEMSPADIAGALGINEAAVRSRLFRARQMLKEKVAVLLETNHGT